MFILKVVLEYCPILVRLKRIDREVLIMTGWCFSLQSKDSNAMVIRQLDQSDRSRDDLSLARRLNPHRNEPSQERTTYTM